MTIPFLHGADSSSPQPNYYKGRAVWGIYVAGDTPHVWTHEEVAAAGRDGLSRVIPIVVPPGVAKEGEQWWAKDETGGYTVLEELARAASAWGVPGGSPLVLDVEEDVAEKMGSVGCASVATAWMIACRTHGFVPWTYGGRTWHEATTDNKGLRWLAEWPAEVPSSLELPGGFHAWQYQGGAEEGRIDLDLFEDGRTYLGTDLQVAVGTTPPPATEPVVADPPPAVEPVSVPEAEPTLAEAQVEEPKVESAIDAQISAERSDEAKGDTKDAATLATKIHVHAEELHALAEEIAAGLTHKESSK